MMYMRPGNLFKDFVVEPKGGSVNAQGRARAKYDKQGSTTLQAVLAEAKPDERERWKQLQHPISHTITQKGSPIAKTSDRLVFGKRCFFVQGVDEPGALGLWTIYYVEERLDTSGH